jgi:hypothetical protein
MQYLTKFKIIALSVIMASVAMGGFGWWYYFSLPPELDAAFKQMLEDISAVRAYTQYVQTEIAMSDRHLRVVGTYYIDEIGNRFASSATTTLTMPDLPPSEREHSFTLQNVSIGVNVYTRIETESELLKKTIPASPRWQRFQKDNIPSTFDNIAVPGPILDNLKLLGAGGTYLTLQGTPAIEKWNDELLTRYSFVLSDTAPKNSGGTLQALFERIGDGTIDVWLDTETAVLKFMRFENDSYISTTTVHYEGAPPPIIAPVL